MITPVTMLIFRVRFGTVNKNQSQECEYIVKFPLIRFNAFSACELKRFDFVLLASLLKNSIRNN